VAEEFDVKKESVKMVAKVVSRKFGGLLFRRIQRFPYKEMAQSYADGLRRKHGFTRDKQPVLVRMTRDKAMGWAVWIRGK
jgi:hypothetical protein